MKKLSALLTVTPSRLLANVLLLTVALSVHQDGAHVSPRGAAPHLVLIRPGDNIQAVVSANPPGTSFLVTAGLYRLQSVTPKDGDTFNGAGQAILSGAALLTSFKRAGGCWITAGQVHEAAYRGTCLPGHPACVLPEDVFIDDVPLQRVTEPADLASGKWYFDRQAREIRLADDPTGHKVEMSVTPHAFYGSASNVTIRSLTIEKYADPAGDGAIHGKSDPGPLSQSWLVEHSDIRLNHGGAIRLGHRMRLIANRIHHNGQAGILGSGRDILVEGNEIAYNNYAGYDYNGEAGGTKFLFTENLVVRNNYVHHNEGPGLWTDGDNVNVLYERNHTAANKVAGILHEVSFLAVIRDNTLEDDGFVPGHTGLWYGSGIHVNSSSDVEIYGNTVTNGMNGIVAVQGNRGSSRRSGRPYTVRNLFVHDNTIIQTTGIAVGLIRSDNYDDSIFTSWNNRFENNTYNLADPTGKYYQWMNAVRSKEEWQGFGNDVHGRWLTPVRAFPPVLIKKEALPE